MNDLKWMEANIDEAKRILKKRGDLVLIDELMNLFKERRDLIISSEELKRKRNEINEILKAQDKSEIEKRREEMRSLSNQVKESDKKLSDLEERFSYLSLRIPNLPRAEVPEGKSAEDNVVVKEVLKKREFDFSPRDHVELGQITDTIDFARAAKISGSRFAFLKGASAKLNRALIQFFIDFHVEQGDIELAPPFLVRGQAMVGVGQFPKFVDDVFKVLKEGDEPFYLIPTAEAPVTNYFADEIINESDLPKRFCAYSPCFRSEAGAAGQDTRGLIRMHQFEKVEMVRFAKPSQASFELDAMVLRASTLLTKLELPHRVVALCGGDLSFSSEQTFDLEVWLPGQQAFREVSSCSSFGSFQARRAKIRMRLQSGKIEPLITLNGSGLPLGRVIVAIFENHQQKDGSEKDGSVKIPKALQAYMGGQEVIEAVN
jgi:seryl-tRNA synthetase